LVGPTQRIGCSRICSIRRMMMCDTNENRARAQLKKVHEVIKNHIQAAACQLSELRMKHVRRVLKQAI
jgi:hypothetical protein